MNTPSMSTKINLDCSRGVFGTFYGNGMDEILMEIWRKHQAINQSKSKSGTPIF
jgi:hypothetical protein